MRLRIPIVIIATLLSGSSLSCSKHDPPPPSPAAPVVVELPDLAKPETWDRKDRPFKAKGRAIIARRSGFGIETEEKCVPTPECKCERRAALVVKGPREEDWTWLAGPEQDRQFYMVSACTGEGAVPQGEVEVEGTFHVGSFVLSKLPKYLDGRKAEPAEKSP